MSDPDIDEQGETRRRSSRPSPAQYRHDGVHASSVEGEVTSGERRDNHGTVDLWWIEAAEREVARLAGGWMGSAIEKDGGASVVGQVRDGR